MAKVKVDMTRREQLRRLHTATHILNHSARKVLGNHVWQNGSHLKPEEGTLDITHYDNLTRGEIEEIEKLVNETIFENKKVFVEELERTEAEQKYGFRVYKGGAIPMKSLRIIHVEDSDTEACGGLHMLSTGGIGLFKLIDAQKIQDGVIRLRYVVREFALDFIHNQERDLESASDVFSVQSSQLVNACDKFFNEWKAKKKEVENLTDFLSDVLVDKALTSQESELRVPSLDMGVLMNIFNSVVKEKASFKLVSEKVVLATEDFEVEGYKKKVPKKGYNMFIL